MNFLLYLRGASFGLVASLGALAAAGCGGGEAAGTEATSQPSTTTSTASAATADASARASTTPSTAYDACKLLTAAEVEAALGEPAGEPTPGEMASQMGQQTCTYTAARPGSPAQVQLSVIRERDFAEQLRKGGIDAVKAFEQGKTVHQSIEAVPGLGDEAYRSEKELLVRSGKVILGMGATTSGGQSASTEALASLARKVLERVPE